MKTIQKQHQIVLVSTDKPSQIHKIGNEIGFTKESNSNPLSKQQFIYVLSDEEIKESDKIYSIEYNKVFTVKSFYETVLHEQAIIFLEGGIGNKKDCKKIIATTNPELKFQYSENHPHDLINLPKPTNQFIQQWIDNGCPEFINVDYEKPEWIPKMHPIANILVPVKNFEKIRIKISSDNTINCSLIEDKRLYTKDEVIKLLKKSRWNVVNNKKNFNQWIEENL